MQKGWTVSQKKRPDAATWIAAGIILAVYVLCLCSSRLFRRPPALYGAPKGRDIRAGRGFDELAQRLYRLFSLGQAGFMLIGAYVYAIFSMSSEVRDRVYQYFDCAIGITLPVIPAILLAGWSRRRSHF